MFCIIIFCLLFSKYCCSNIRSVNLLYENDTTVHTNNGAIIGYKCDVPGNTEFSYYAFQGIPFAEPPVGEKRFLPPQMKKAWKGILNATQDNSACMQIMQEGSKTKVSEDCLFLNVYTPNPNGSYPVMVYFYGGAFIAGSAAKQIYGPDYLIQENVVLVVPNYRVGIFGFLSTQDSVVPGNNGLKDQIMALEWVKGNIRAFGGNPDSVTIFGESAGSASVSLLLQAKTTKGLFHGAIMESGVSLSAFSRTRNPLDMTFLTAKSLNIFANTSEELVDKLRAVSAEDLLLASLKSMVQATVIGNPLDGLYFSPCIEPDHEGAVISGYTHELLTKGLFSKVPIIVGFNSAEGNPFEDAVIDLPLFLLRYDLQNALFVPSSMNVKESLEKIVGSEIKKYYFRNESVTVSESSLSKYISDDQFIRPTIEFVRLVSSFVTTYLYEFSYVGSVADRKLPGVGHAEDVAYLWNDGDPLNERDAATSKKLVKLWTNFAKYRNPTPSRKLYLDNVIWMPSDSVNLTYLQINTTLYMEKNPRKKDMDFWSTLYKTYGNPPYDTY